MDRNTLIGLLLLCGLFYVWLTLNQPTEEELAAQQRSKDSLEMVESNPSGENPEGDKALVQGDTAEASTEQNILSDSTSKEEEIFYLENDVARYAFSSKGGGIVGTKLKNFKAISAGDKDEDVKSDLMLLDDKRNAMEYIIPGKNGTINTGRLDFEAEKHGNSLSLSTDLPGGGTLEQNYTIGDDYSIDYKVLVKGLRGVAKGSEISLNWVDYLSKLEKNAKYEKYYATQYYKEADDSPTYLSAQKADAEEINNALKWVAHSNQFFSSVLIADQNFTSASLEVAPIEEDSALLFAQSDIKLRLDQPSAGQTYNMQFYIGPNDFENYKELGYETQDLIPFGWSIFGTINRWIIRPIFNFLSGYIGSKGVVILILTVLIKLALYPLTYRMLKSQTLMGGLKDQIAAIKEKNKDDSQATQMETMKLYREYGVNPLGGCFPMVLQMPIWFALYRFFPASIEFRQEPFLWADDLSSYDVFWHLPFEIPFMGSHISLFTLLWAVSLFGYTWYNMNRVNVSQANMNPMMKNMQLVMPVMFLFFLNSYASGLTAYLLFSNLFNITQTVFTKKVIFNEEKIRFELKKKKEKPKKPKGKFRQRLDEIMKEQQKIAQEQEKKKNKSKS